MLVEEDAEATLCEDGKHAVDSLRDIGPGKFDMVLMDIQMPIMDGYTASRLISEIDPELPIIGVSAHVLQEDKDKSRAAGMIDHVTKPILIDDLVAAILKHLVR
jgi:two-component system, sensor histidine kinase and response regulator